MVSVIMNRTRKESDHGNAVYVGLQKYGRSIFLGLIVGLNHIIYAIGYLDEMCKYYQNDK